MKRLLTLLFVVFPSSVAAASNTTNLCNGANLAETTTADCSSGSTSLSTIIGTSVNLLLYIAGALAVLVLIYGGIRYITSTGDAARVKAAKDTIVYAIIGLIVSLLAYAIVNFVVARF